jgi:hypothetical protein
MYVCIGFIRTARITRALLSRVSAIYRSEDEVPVSYSFLDGGPRLSHQLDLKLSHHHDAKMRDTQRKTNRAREVNLSVRCSSESKHVGFRPLPLHFINQT